LLSAIGQPSFLAVVNSSNPLVTALPSLAQFDHMVVCVPRTAAGQSPLAERWTIIDTTLKNFPATFGVPPQLAGRQLLVLDPQNPRLIRAAANDPQSSLIRCDQQVSYMPDGAGPGSLRVEEQLDLAPLAAAWLREWLRDLPDSERKAAFRKLLDEEQNFELQALEIKYLKELEKNLTVRLTYSVPEAFHVIAGESSSRLLGSLPHHWAKLLVATTRAPERTTPFELSLPAQFVGKTTFRLAPGQKLIPPVTLRDEGRAACARWRRTDVVTADALERTLIWSQTAGAFAKTEYEPYFREAQRALRSYSQPVTIELEAVGRE
jgi:hypothetical protein